MNIIRVIPLTRSKIADELSYFTSSDIPVGAIVSVPVRSKSMSAIVTSVQPAEDLKSDIKNAPFVIRKLGKLKATSFFPPQFMDAAEYLASYYATTLGNTIDCLVADSILEQAHKIAPPLPRQSSFDAVPETAMMMQNQDETYAVQGDDADRISTWRSLIRQEFARKKSVAIHVPTIDDARFFVSALEKGIEGYIFLLHGSLTKKQAADQWAKIADIDHPIVVISTGSFSLLPRGDIETVVIERESGRGWIVPKSPYIDFRHSLETVARRRRQTVFIADSMLRTETLRRLDAHDISEGSPFKWRSISTARDVLVDMRTKNPREARRSAAPDAESEETPEAPVAIGPSFKVLSPELENLIRSNQEESTHLFVLATRRGTSPITVCSDCESVVSCAQCSSPVVLHTSKESGRNFFMCHTCGTRRSADEVCVVCGGWRLVPLGVGIDLVRNEIERLFPGIETFKIDADSTKTDKQIAETAAAFRAKPGSVLLGTEMAIHHIPDRIDHIAIVSLDSLFALPDFRIQEKIMYTLIRLRAQATRTFLVQSRRPDERVFEFGLKGNLSDAYRATLAERKQFNYPPFSILIKLTVEGKKDAIARIMADAQKLLEPREIDVFPAFTSTVRGNSVIHGLMRIETGAWPDPEVAGILKSLPPNVSVKINPETLL